MTSTLNSRNLLGPAILAGLLDTSKFMHVQEVKAQGSAGGTATATAGVWPTRILNTKVVNTIPGADLVSNQMQLPIGTYLCIARAPTYATARTRARLYNASTGDIPLVGSSQYATSSGAQCDCWVFGLFTLATASYMELQQGFGASQASNGLGVESSRGAEIYSEVLLFKVA